MTFTICNLTHSLPFEQPFFPADKGKRGALLNRRASHGNSRHVMPSQKLIEPSGCHPYPHTLTHTPIYPPTHPPTYPPKQPHTPTHYHAHPYTHTLPTTHTTAHHFSRLGLAGKHRMIAKHIQGEEETGSPQLFYIDWKATYNTGKYSQQG